MFVDFRVNYDPEVDSLHDLTLRILYSLIIRRIKANKPTVMFIGGDSGEGKSSAGLKVMEVLMECIGLELYELLDDVNVFQPLQYPEKLERLLFPKKFWNTDEPKYKLIKKAPFICLHEARTLIKAKDWQGFVNQAIGDVNALSRSIKRLCIIIISQFIRDISTDIRYTLNYYCTVKRPNKGNATLSMWRIWKDDRDIEKPSLRKRYISGIVLVKGGKNRLMTMRDIELTKPSKLVADKFDQLDFEAKGILIHKKMEAMMKKLKAEYEDDSAKITAMVDYYITNPQVLLTIGRLTKKGYQVKDSVKKMHDLSPSDYQDFQNLLNNKMIEKNVMGMGVKDDVGNTE